MIGKEKFRVNVSVSGKRALALRPARLFSPGASATVAAGRGGRAMGALETLLAGIARCPEDDMAWLALADCLDEQGEHGRAELARVQLNLRRRLDDPSWPEWQRRQHELWRAGVAPCLPV